MLTLNTFNCPKCSEKIPIYFPRAKRIKRGRGQSPIIVCPACGHQCRQVLHLQTAIWSWPLTAMILVLVLIFLRKLPWSPVIQFSNPILQGVINGLLYGIVSGLIFGVIIGVGIRSGYRLLSADMLEKT